MSTRWMSIAVGVLMSAGAVLAQENPPLPPPAELAKRSGCFECHSVDKKVVGPAWQDVAARYRNDVRAREQLIRTVKKGGKGNWTRISRGVPMPPHSPRLSDEQITSLVNWILGLASEKR